VGYRAALIAVPGSRESRALIWAVCAAVSLVWIGTGFFLDEDAVNRLGVAAYPGQGFYVVIRLVVYPFLQWRADSREIFFEMTALAGIAFIAGERLSAAGFIRLFSFGGILAGGGYLAGCIATGTSVPLTGPQATLVTMCTSLSIWERRRAKGDEWDRGDFLVLMTVAAVLILSSILQTARAAAAYAPGGQRPIVTTLVALGAGVGAGAVYAWVDILWRTLSERKAGHG